MAASPSLLQAKGPQPAPLEGAHFVGKTPAKREAGSTGSHLALSLQGNLWAAGREGKILHFSLSTKVAALFFCCCQPLICLKRALVKLRTDQTETNICANYSFWKIGNNGPKGINTPTVNHRKPMREKAVWALKRTVQMSSGNRTARGINFPTNEQCTRRPAADGSDSLLFCVLF